MVNLKVKSAVLLAGLFNSNFMINFSKVYSVLLCHAAHLRTIKRTNVSTVYVLFVPFLTLLS